MREFNYKLNDIFELECVHFYKLVELTDLARIEKIEELLDSQIQCMLLKSKESRKDFDTIRSEYSDIRNRYLGNKVETVSLKDFLGGE